MVRSNFPATASTLSAEAKEDVKKTVLLRLFADKLLIIDERPSQAAFVAYEHLRHEDPIVVEFERFVRARLDEPFNVAFVAQSLGTSRRTLERRVRAALNLTPLGFVQRLRIERARHLSATTDLTSAEIALRVGYANAETLRSLLRRERRRS